MLVGAPVRVAIHFTGSHSNNTFIRASAFNLCFIYGSFHDSHTLLLDPATTTLKSHCFEKGLTSGSVYLPRGYHRFGIYVQASDEIDSPRSPANAATPLLPVSSVPIAPITTYAQVIDYSSSNVTTSVWSCRTTFEQCQQEFVDTVNTPPEKYNATATSSHGHGIHVAKAVISIPNSIRLLQLANQCSFDQIGLDTIDGAPTIQVDLWHKTAGVPGPTVPSLLLTSEIFLTVMPPVLSMIHSMYPWAHTNITCTDAFVRRYRPGERLGVESHADTSDITVNCLLSSSDQDFASGFPYRFVNEHEIDVIPTMQGDCIFHAGQIKHGVVPTEEGTRYTLILFWSVKRKFEGSTSYAIGTKNHGYNCIGGTCTPVVEG